MFVNNESRADSIYIYIHTNPTSLTYICNNDFFCIITKPSLSTLISVITFLIFVKTFYINAYIHNPSNDAKMPKRESDN